MSCRAVERLIARTQNFGSTPRAWETLWVARPSWPCTVTVERRGL